MSEGVVRSLRYGRFLDWRALDAEGAAGGILICWDKRSLDILDWEEGHFTLSCRFRNVDNGVVWVFTGVYGPFTKVERDGLWEEFGAIRGLWEDPWCLGEDFNITLLQSERSSQRRINSTMRRFAEVVDELGLVDLPLQGESSPGMGPVSDHFPILLVGGGIRRGSAPFRFENMWLKVEGFKDLIRSWWWGIEVRGSASFRLVAKMKEIKQKLKVRNREVFGRLDCNKSSALQQVDFWDWVECERSLTVEETESKKEAKESYKKWVLLEEFIGDNFQGDLAKERDRNTGFFHHMASAHRRNNSLDKVKINGEWFSEEQKVREGIANAFQQLLSEDMGWKADIRRLQLDQISQQDAELEIPFSETEVHSALMEMNGDKAPVIANRIKKVVGKVVSTTQNAFVTGRQILDASLIANEVIDLWQKRKEKGLICKLDIEKAYNSINWKFLLKVLQKMGFGLSGWGGCGVACLQPNSQFLLMGFQLAFSQALRGLDKEIPISLPLCYGMEVLDVLIRRAVEGGFLSRCSIRGGSRSTLNISHLFFADDTIVFCEASKEHLTHLSWILLWFEAASSLRINLDKSEIIPVGAPNRAPSMWDGVEERVRRRLALWKPQYISKGGRITLIKSTLASMPICQMSIFQMPKIVARRLEKVQRDFLWGVGNLEGKTHLVKWEVVCTDKNKGGLGLRKLALLNKALLGKWIWRYACNKDNLWKQVITTKYGQEGLDGG
ncbi:putative ribonuclease H protein [Vitis vinifera]|uniref:Putative ribonuclease H protein n=1 Tax=Vitis vinifera TaxID=29760 RepID=A0A438CP83_VITVI|nr:putative ribonuclease H protein [Vitis vinifera]